ncbi:related to fatty acid omega-hydroxylase (P450foxy) [Cephalotrichum gorgonifer]|uniref:Related to fatty acid omega-hydroxylase (P450foxy) n=1 Tax=Cephalotrichum gorgonifer TaxID=2041049 RepID=A0AAE8MTC3_9PEZI|nr:related to fatty acid omega-hydroxylase (P450foxy) [Cephalotrichum gorgonifer]
MPTPIPQPPGLPVVGNIFDIDPNNTWASLKKLAEKYGEIFQINVLGHRIVFVAGVALAGELCDETRFRKYVGGPIVEIRAAVHDSLFTAYDHEESWGIAHRIIAPQLSTSSIAQRFGDIRDTATELIQGWKTTGGGNHTLELLEQLNRLNLEATTLALFGKKLNGLTGPIHPMVQAMEDSTSEAMKRPNRPAILNKLVHGGKFKKSIRTMREYADEIVEHRKANPGDDARNDVLSALLHGKDPQTGKGFTESQVIDEIVTMPIGSSTAPCLITTAIYFLLKNPAALEKARAEVDRVLGQGGEFTYGHVAQLNYIDAIVKESLRLAFPAPGFNIEPIPKPGDESPVPLGGGKYEVAHNQAMIIVLAGVNRDPAVFEDPLEFRPERMLGEAFDNLPLGAKRWYGNGKRECIGKHYAWLWNMVVLAKLVLEVDFDMKDPAYKLEKDGWFNVRPIDFLVKVKPRVI